MTNGTKFVALEENKAKIFRLLFRQLPKGTTKGSNFKLGRILTTG
ncbi:hypothetical protein D082_14140 [Synechocystis sp. PCC 6714]|nr:hypothetical protein D082_14140 [Synechocystis sp. PCC 6714]